ncbi:MAG: hypothetical protein QNJ51_03140 [Calothrix sp. MO_167.B12]|nr:hypothetical protein [Calothrix sp. MO_167.B12]
MGKVDMVQLPSSSADTKKSDKTHNILSCQNWDRDLSLSIAILN